MRILTVLFCILFSAHSFAAEAPIAPDWTLADTEGSARNLEQELEGGTTVLFFWATWCPYCKALIPHLQSIKLEYGDDVTILALNFRESGDPAAYAEEHGLNFVMLLEADAVADAYKIYGTPGLLLIDSGQQISFDLRKLPRIEPPETDGKPGHGRRAAFLAPYWAAELRKAIDDDLAARQSANSR